MIKFKLHNLSGKSPVYQLPENWEEVKNMGDKLAIVRILMRDDMDEYACRVAILRRLLNVSDKLFKAIPDDVIAQLTTCLKWLNIEPSTTPKFWFFEHQKHTFYLPLADFANGSGAEWVLALDYYGAYAESKDPNDLLKFVAVLARESRNDLYEAAINNDIRVLIHDNGNEADERAKLLKGLPDEISICILRYFEGVKLMFHKLGIEAELWQEPKEGEEPQGVALFGWRTTFRNIAEKGPFGTDYETVSQRKFWEIFQFLLEKKAANDEYERKMQEIQSKND
jgi:hypothetical protein